jgi:hypothetical protein
VRPHTEERRLPQHEVRELADLDRADLCVQAVCDRRADGVFRNVTAGAVVVGRAIAVQRAAAALHHVRGLPGADDDLTDPSHRLRVAADHRDGTEVVQQVFGGDRRRADAAFGEREILWDAGIEVVTHHQHVEMLVEGVDRVRSRRVGRTRQHIGFCRDGDDVGCVSAACTFGVIGVDGPARDGADGVLDEAGLVEGVGVQRHLNPGGVGHLQAGVDGGGSGSPVFVQLET